MASSSDLQTQHRQRLRRQWLLLGAAFALAAGALTGVAAWRHAQAANQQEQRLRQQVRLVSDLLARQLDSVDAALASVLDEARGLLRGEAASPANERLRRLEAAIPGVRTLNILDAGGVVLASSREELVGLNFSQRDYFRIPLRRNDATVLHVSRPFRTRLDVWGLNLVRTVQHADGRWAGAVAATLDPQFFTALLAPANFAPDMWGAVGHDTAVLLLMAPARPDLDGTDLGKPGSMFSRHRDDGRTETAFWGRVASTGEDRVIVQRTVRPSSVAVDHGLVVALSRDAGAAFAGWRTEVAFGGALFLLSVALAVVGLRAVHRGERRQLQAQEAARLAVLDNEQRWALALEGSGVGVWDWNPQTHTVFYSRVWQAMLGHDEQALGTAGDEWLRRVHPADLPAIQQALRDHLEGRSDHFSAEHRMRCADGRYKWVLDQGRVFSRDEAGRPLRVVGTQTDITERREADALRLERDVADAANRAKTEFLSRMSHELRTPLNAILGFAQLLLARTEPALPPDQRLHLQHIEQAGWHLLEMINDMLDLTRIEAGKLALHMQPVAVGPTVAAAVALVQGQAHAAGVSLTTAQIPDEAVVEGDPLRLRQVLVNLLTNAIKYNHAGGRVEIDVDPGDAGCLIAVNDTGLGMSGEQVKRLFEPFNRLGHAKSSIEGVGIGLVISRWLVEAMGGTLTVRSVEGKGSTFTLRLHGASSAPPKSR